MFHYFPHNLHSIRLEESRILIEDIIKTMELVVERIKTKNVQDQLLRYDILST
ncbi:MAG: hypothetical protein UZ22_OP11002001139 [Microgenomates bacterium OLB23]|nr:MAG: hypothetical protein UZ22_OP11002001139 [Microgenomates bacterium OLB23]